ncbi:MAG: Ig-like domain-containing protein [Planctomycetota bacterium]
MPRAARSSLSTAFLAPGVLVLAAACGDDDNGLHCIEVTPADALIAAGTSQEYVATGIFENGERVDMTSTVAWGSSEPAIVTLDGATATGVAPGASIVRAVDPTTGLSGSATLTVTDAALVSLAITPPAPQIALGTQVQLVATGTFTDATVQDLTGLVDWTSSDGAIAAVVAGLVQGAGTGAATITATDPATGIDASVTLTVTPAVLVSIGVTPALPSIALGTDQAFVATGTYSDSTVQDLTASVAWSSSVGAVATVDASGLATSAAIGATVISATDPATSIAGDTTLIVTPAELVSIAVTPVTPSIVLGTSQAFVATGTYTDATVQDLTASVTWDSSSPGVATIANASGTEGRATSVSAGATTVTATDHGTGIFGSTTLTVTPAELVAIAVTPANPSIALGTDQAFTATGTYTDASVQDLTTSVTWTSSALSVATVSNAGGSQGLASSAGTGVTTITATDPATMVAGDTTLTVTPAELVSIDVTPAMPSVALGLDRAFTATGTYTDASVQDLTTAVTWSSSVLAVATISNAGGSQGLATGAGTGVTTITATHAPTMVAGDTTLTVTAAELVSIAVAPTVPSIALGLDQAFTATGTFTDASMQDLTTTVTWTSSAMAVATISNAGGSEGVASSAGTGVTTITATDPATMVAADTTLTVTAAELVSIAVTPATPSIALGTDQAFTATGTYTDASTQDLTTTVTWASSAAGVATISNVGGSEGVASSVAVGMSTITATEPGTLVAGDTALSVTPAELVSIAVAAPNPAITIGSTEPFTATGTYTDASVQDLTTSVTWSSSATGVATVSNAGGSEGLATAVGAGATTITATDPATMIADDAALEVLADIAFVATGTAASAAALDLDVPTPAGTAAGDLLLAAIAVRPSSATVTPPAGWTLIRRTDTTTAVLSSLLTYRRVAEAGEPAMHRWSFSASTGSAAAIVAFRGVESTSPVDVEGGQETPSALAHAAPSVTTTTSRAMLVTAHGYASSGTWTPPAGMTEVADLASLAPEDPVGISLSVNVELLTVAGATGPRAATASGNSDSGTGHALALSPGP